MMNDKSKNIFLGFGQGGKFQFSIPTQMLKKPKLLAFILLN